MFTTAYLALPYDMNGEEGQPTLWSSEQEALRRALDAARERWQQARREHGIGTAEEIGAWQEFRAQSDRYWEIIRQTW